MHENSHSYFIFCSLFNTHKELFISIHSILERDLRERYNQFIASISTLFQDSNDTNDSATTGITADNLKYVQDLISKLRILPLKIGRGLLLRIETSHQVPTIYFVDELFNYFQQSDSFKTLLGVTDTLSITFNVFNGTR